ncbi:MAG: response regulator [Chlorobi bacterium]|nr:response regulator [Chlorobiota bacterium]
MKKEVVILFAEDDPGHALLTRRSLHESGVVNEIIHFHDGEEIETFLQNHNGKVRIGHKSYLVLLDIKMPRRSGIDVLETIKGDKLLKKIPVIMLTTTDDPREINRCHELGCNMYITKPVTYEKFLEVIRKLGLFLQIVEIPKMNDNHGPGRS